MKTANDNLAGESFPAMTNDTRPDYQIAAENLATLFDSLNLPWSHTEAIAARDSDDWLHVSFAVQIGGEMFPWKCGVGHVKKLFPISGSWTLNSVSEVLMRNRNAKISPACATEELAFWCNSARKSGLKPNPAEVLASACRDGQEAMSLCFEDWADSLGYDRDSRKAEATYNECRRLGSQALRILGRANFDKFSELSERL